MDEGHTRTGKPRSSLEKPRVTALLAGERGEWPWFVLQGPLESLQSYCYQ